MDAFVDALRSGASVSKAASSAGIGRTTVYRHRDLNEDFKKNWDDAVEIGTDRLEDEALRRAIEGDLRPVYQGGAHVGDVIERDTTLLIFLLKARRPEKYRERKHVKVDGQLSIAELAEAADEVA